MKVASALEGLRVSVRLNGLILVQTYLDGGWKQDLLQEYL